MMAVSRLPVLVPSCSRHRRTPLTDVAVIALRLVAARAALPVVRLRRRLLEWSATTNADAPAAVRHSEAQGALNLSNALLLLLPPAPEKDGERRDTTNSDNAATEGMQRRRARR